LIARAAIAGCALAALGCYSPAIQDGQFTCATTSVCPSGFQCVAGVCHTSGAVSDGGQDAAADAAMSDAGVRSPCSNGGARSPGDPGIAGVALCPAAWLVPGVTSLNGLGTPCNRQPTANGKNAQGTACSASDNCILGWHVCAGETELANLGFDTGQCSGALAASNALWITRQVGDVPMSGGMPSGPPSCAIAMEHIVFGCGQLGGPSGPSCTILNRVLLDDPMTTTTDECSTTSGGAFLCHGVGPGMPEARVVTKPALAGGGVMCCLD
jgi:hypothetical protein